MTSYAGHRYSRTLYCGSLLAVLLSLCGCAELPYYWQSINGHVDLMRAAKPVAQWLESAQTPALLKEKLALSQRIRRFAVTDLALPDNASYQRYADLQRHAVVWNVVAAPPWSLTLKTWCFPVTGCVGYRGYFDESLARAYAAELRVQGLEASVYGVPAYSTLGWMNWAGGDPLLSTFITYPEGELARMVFHELAHQALFVQDDTPFNESFATAVERIGGAQWLELHGSTQALAEFDALTTRRAQFRALTRATRHQLANLYADQVAILTLNTAQAAMKEKIMQDFRAQYAELKASWSASSQPGTPQFGGYDAWVANANNAAFGAQAAYDVWVPQFEALFQQEARTSRGIQTWQQFYATVKRLAELPLGERTLALERIELPSHAVTNP